MAEPQRQPERPDYTTWWSIARTVEEMGVSRRTVYNWLYSGKLEYVRTVSDKVRINPTSLFKASGSAGARP